MSGCEAGWATVDITPGIGCWLGGYADRSAPADAIHDALYAGALALGSRKKPFVIVLCDVVAVDDAMTQAVRQRVTAAVEGSNVWLAATHTHSGPVMTRVLATDKAEPAIVERVIAGAVRAAVAAVGRMHPVYARWASGLVDDIATNRDHPLDDDGIYLDLLCLYDDEQAASSPSAILGSFPCHPTVMGADNLAISADLSGAFRDQMHASIGRATWVALATGASADISTRQVRREQSFEELERLGRLLALHAQDLIRKGQPVVLGIPVVRDRHIVLERKSVPNEASLEAASSKVMEQRAWALETGNGQEARTLETTLQGIRAATRYAEVQDKLPGSTTISAATVGNLRLAAIPGELYHQLGEELRHRLGSEILLLGYTNGYIGYVPTREAYQTLDYEVLMSHFVPGTGERIVSAVLGLLADGQEVV